MEYVNTKMLGAIIGDFTGSIYEHRNIKYKLDYNSFIHPLSRFTDDTVMTLAVASGMKIGLDQVSDEWMNNSDEQYIIYNCIQDKVVSFARSFPLAGYGKAFRNWFLSSDPQPYNSWGNGSAMRVSYAGWCAKTLEEAEKLAEISASITHNHMEGIKGAKAVAGCIYMLRTNASKEDIRQYVSQYYNIDFTLDDIRDTYTFDVSCQGSVPHAIVAFLEGKDFVDVISLAISIGGDSDTIAAIAGSLAEVIYPVPSYLVDTVLNRLADELKITYHSII